MASVEVLKYQNDRNFIEHHQVEDAVDSWFMMGSPLPIVLTVSAYLYFVLRLGPRLMESRKPFNLKYVMIVYNLYQVVFSSWICSLVLLDIGVMKHLYTYSCIPMPRKSNPYLALMTSSSWWYFFSKLIELLDTVFFVVRKKQNQVSVLHVYHHANMLVSTWAYLKYVRGEQAVIPGFINSFVHVIMYSYYLLAACGPSVQKYLWWKKYITKLQLGQFVVILLFLISLLAFDCKVPRGLTIYMSTNTLIFLVLFVNFYYQSYIKRQKTD